MRKNLQILIVDDNMNFVNRMIGMLEELDNIAFINVAENYDEACRHLAEQEPDIALLDINLPGKNGLALLKLIKQTIPECEVIMITNHADEYYRQQCHDMGAGHFLDKTIEFGLVPGIISGKNPEVLTAGT
jgi:two-component system chemotaxis response regulator CheY